MRSQVLAGALALALARTIAAHEELSGLPWPSRELEWKDVNFISISDTHGWLLGHQHATWPEPNYSGDYGSFASFVTHMRSIAEDKGVDLLVVDAGDHHDGSGLVSSSSESAAAADEIFNTVSYDILTVGNHELYQYDSARWIYDNRRRWGGRYLTSNVNITVEEGGRSVSKPLADRYIKFETAQGNKVTALGIIFDFQAHAKKLAIQSPKDLARESWFLETIEEAPDYFVLVGHMPARNEAAEWEPVFQAIRVRHPHVPIYVFGGHSHVRDCVQYDDHSIAVVPGRYMETIAFTSSSLPTKEEPNKALNVARRYLDANKHSYLYHTKTEHDTFDLPMGKNITIALLNLAASLKISKPLGLAPSDFFLARYPYGHPKSILTEWGANVLPATVHEKGRPETRLIITQTGSLRFDLFQGGFNRNDELTLSPFANAFVYVQLRAGLAKKVTAQMNRAGASKFVPDQPRTQGEEDDRVERIYQQWLSDQAMEDEMSRPDGSDHSDTEQMVFSGAGVEGESAELKHRERHGGQKKLTLGYVTKDACPGKGDDIEHIPLPHSYKQPDFISTAFPEGLSDDEEIDVIVMDFALDDFVAAVNVLAPATNLTSDDLRVYAEGTKLNEIWGAYAKMAWQP